MSGQLWMDAWGQASVLGDALEQVDELAVLVGVEWRQQVGVVFVGGALGPDEQLPCLAREEQRVSAAVVGMAATLDESAGLEVVDERDHLVAVDAHRIGELLLGSPVDTGQVGEQPEVPRTKAQRPQALGKSVGCVEAELGEQEARTVDQAGAGSCGRRVWHRRDRCYPL